MTYYGECFSREAWLNKSQRNYISADLIGRTYEEEITKDTNPADVCENIGGIILIEGHMCSCPEGYYLGVDPDNVSCKPFPEKFDKNHLRVGVEYTYNGKHLTQSYGLLTFEECTSEDRKWHVTQDQ